MRTLRMGSAGTYVEILQTALLRAGYDPGTVDGIFGGATSNALRRFQEKNGLYPDCIAGRMTWARLMPYITGYTICTAARGDTFFSIAEEYRTSPQAISTANPGINPLSIPVGARLVVPLGFQVVPTDISWSHELLELVAEGLMSRYPFIRGGSIGTSVMGRDIYYLQMGSGPRQVMYNAAHHANEWITTPVLLKFVEDLAYAYSTGGSIFNENARELLNRVTLYVVPMVDPDGVDLVTGALSKDSPFYAQAQRIAQAYPDIPFPSGWKANIMGTDLNLNYPANWELARDIKFDLGFTTPAPRDYVGAEPLSAVESSAMYSFTVRHDFCLTLSYHTQGEVIYWKYSDYEPARSYEIARAFAEASGYQAELTPPGSAYAGYKDWFIQTYDRPGYTIEAGLGENPLPISQFPRIYRDNIGILTLGMKLA